MYRSLLFVVLSFFYISVFSQDVPVQFEAQPQNPIEGEVVLVEGSVVFPHPGFELNEITDIWDSSTETVTLVFTVLVDRVGIYPQVEHEVKFRHRFVSPTTFTDDVSNHIQVRQVIPDEPFVIIEPLPEFVKESLRVTLSPIPAISGKPIRASIRGELPSSGYNVMNKSITINNHLITINLTVASPEDVDLPVITPFIEHLQLNPLRAGQYSVELIVNGEAIRSDRVEVIEDPNPPQRRNPFNARFIVPPVVTPGSIVSVGVMGDFPTAGWEFGGISVQTADDITSIEVEAIEPSGAAATVITPFQKQIAMLEVSAGVHFIRGKINGHAIPSVRVLVGNAPIRENVEGVLIRLQRTGGIAGDNSWIEIDSRGNYELQNRFIGTNDANKGRLLSSTFNRLLVLFEESSFNDFPVRIEPNVSVADAFQYTLIYNDTGILIEYVEAAPAELQALVRNVEELLNNPAQTSNVDTKKWMIYN